MMKVHQGSVDTYLEDVILQSTEMTADEQVSRMIIVIIIIIIAIIYAGRPERKSVSKLRLLIKLHSSLKLRECHNVVLCLREDHCELYCTVLYVMCRRNELESKEMVAEMVYYFLLPEVEKHTIREKGIVIIHVLVFQSPITLFYFL